MGNCPRYTDFGVLSVSGISYMNNNLSPPKLKYFEETVMFRIILRARTKKNEVITLSYDGVMAKTSTLGVPIIV